MDLHAAAAKELQLDVAKTLRAVKTHAHQRELERDSNLAEDFAGGGGLERGGGVDDVARHESGGAGVADPGSTTPTGALGPADAVFSFLPPPLARNPCEHALLPVPLRVPPLR